VVIDGRKRRLVDEIDAISSVSGGSFTAGYYGLFEIAFLRILKPVSEEEYSGGLP